MAKKAKKYRLDRSAFGAMTFQEADDEMRYYKKVSWQERLAVAYFLTGLAYKFDLDNPPRMDKTMFSINKN